MDKDSIMLLGLSALAFIVLPFGVMWILYFIPKKLGYSKLGEKLALGFLIFYIVILIGSLFVK